MYCVLCTVTSARANQNVRVSIELNDRRLNEYNTISITKHNEYQPIAFNSKFQLDKVLRLVLCINDCMLTHELTKNTSKGKINNSLTDISLVYEDFLVFIPIPTNNIKLLKRSAKWFKLKYHFIEFRNRSQLVKWNRIESDIYDSQIRILKLILTINKRKQ